MRVGSVNVQLRRRGLRTLPKTLSFVVQVRDKLSCWLINANWCCYLSLFCNREGVTSVKCKLLFVIRSSVT